MQIMETEKRSSGGINQAYGIIDKYEYQLMYTTSLIACYVFDQERKLVIFEDKKRNKFWSCKVEAKEILKELYRMYSLND